MSGELADRAVDKAPSRSRPRLELSDPGVTFVTSGAVWVLLLVGIVQFSYDLSTFEAATRDARVLAWFGVAMFGLLVAIVAAVVYIVDHRRRRGYHPRGYRAPLKTRFTVVEAFGGLVLIAYTGIVIASALSLAFLVVDIRGREFAIPTPEEVSFLVVIVVVYCYHLLVFPAAGSTFLTSRRHKRRYPDESTREGHGFHRSARALIAANTITIVALVVIEMLVLSAQIPG